MSDIIQFNSHFRLNVCGIIQFKEFILVCERSDYQNSWQFPQGGIEHQETVTQAFYREMNEELSYEVEDFSLIEISSNKYTYEFPKSVKKKGDKYIGQEQTFVKATLRKEKIPKLNHEFRSFLWINPKQLNGLNFSYFKKNNSIQALKDFKLL